MNAPLPALRPLILSLLLAPGSLLCAANWPMWRGANGDGTCTESNLPEKWSATENVVWFDDGWCAKSPANDAVTR